MDALEKDMKSVDAFMEGRRLLILKLQQSKGLKASGLSAKLLHTSRNGNVSSLIDAAAYFEYQQFGRAPGNKPPVKKIYDWLQFKKYGLSWDTDKHRWGLAWAITKKIATKGTFTHRHGESGVLSEAISNEALREVIKTIIANHTSEILTDIKRILV